MCSPSLIRTVYVATIALASFFLFLIQPLISKYILPYFGGAPSVWSTSLLFFMTILLGGYLYSFLISKLSIKRQVIFHITLILSAGLILLKLFIITDDPVLLPLEALVASSLAPMIKVLAVLAMTVGIPYFLLTTTSTLLQYWYGQLGSTKPYRFYVYSNIASFAAVIGYPFVIEPIFPLEIQSSIWIAGYIMFLALFGIATLQYYLSSKSGVKVQERVEYTTKSYTRRDVFVWLAISTTTALLLVATTTEITLGVASVPFLWLLPLAFYLLSFVISFRDGSFPQWILFFYVALALATFFYANTKDIDFYYMATLYPLFLLASTILLHKKLYDFRPTPQYLTHFYLFVSLGGVVGGVLANIVAPLIFTHFIEFPVGVVIAFIIVLKTYDLPDLSANIGKYSVSVYTVVITVMVIYASSFVLLKHTLYDYSERNFFGVIQIHTEEVPELNSKKKVLSHGGIIHGSQFTREDLQRTSTMYYVTGSGIGVTFAYKKEQLKNADQRGLRAGIIGLGTGTLANECRPNDHFIFYEINPAITRIAENHFSYLEGCEGHLEVREGDARILLQNEDHLDNSFDIIAVDAFSDDAIPVHLLTKEAFELYLKNMVHDGILAIHISNKHLDLVPLMNALATEFAIDHVIFNSAIDTDKSPLYDTNSSWALFSRDKNFFKDESVTTMKKLDTHDSDYRTTKLWTDRFSNILSVIKF